MPILIIEGVELDKSEFFSKNLRLFSKFFKLLLKNARYIRFAPEGNVDNVIYSVKKELSQAMLIHFNFHHAFFQISSKGEGVGCNYAEKSTLPKDTSKTYTKPSYSFFFKQNPIPSCYAGWSKFIDNTRTILIQDCTTYFFTFRMVYSGFKRYILPVK